MSGGGILRYRYMYDTQGSCLSKLEPWKEREGEGGVCVCVWWVGDGFWQREVGVLKYRPQRPTTLLRQLGLATCGSARIQQRKATRKLLSTHAITRPQTFTLPSLAASTSSRPGTLPLRASLPGRATRRSPVPRRAESALTAPSPLSDRDLALVLPAVSVSPLVAPVPSMPPPSTSPISTCVRRPGSR